MALYLFVSQASPLKKCVNVAGFFYFLQTFEENQSTF